MPVATNTGLGCSISDAMVASVEAAANGVTIAIGVLIALTASVAIPFNGGIDWAISISAVTANAPAAADKTAEP